ncbi:hypothetical protein L7F22_012464 [Adiantum nelumboides]|nr:hypothetical protein [Adiantum nelumboides]
MCIFTVNQGVMRQIQHSEALGVMSALASVKEKVQILESEASQHTELSPSCNVDTAIADLSESIDQTLAKFALLQKSIGSLGSIIGEDPNITFSEENACFNLLLKSKGQFLTSQELNSSPKGEGDQIKVGSADVDLVVNGSIDNLLTPLRGRNHYDDDGWSSEIVIEQLLGELESAAAKVANMEAQINLLKKTEWEREGVTTILDKSTCLACKEFDSKVRLLGDAEKKLATCTEACKKKEKAISSLRNENSALQEVVLKLRSLQVTPKVVTSNMLFNLDSPVKMDSPQRTMSPFSSWRHLDEISRDGNTSLQGDSVKGSCNSSDMYRSEIGNPVPHYEDSINELGCVLKAPDDSDRRQHEGGKNASACTIHVTKAIGCNNITFRRGITTKDSAIYRSCEDEVSCRSSSSSTSTSTNDLSRKSGTSSTRSSSDNNSSGSVANARLSHTPKTYSSHAKKLKFTISADLRLSDDSYGSQTSGRWRDDGGSLLNSKAGHVLARVEPNTPLRDRKLTHASKEKLWGHNVDSLSKAKENFTQRKRWM